MIGNYADLCAGFRAKEYDMKLTWLLPVALLGVLCACTPKTPLAGPTFPVSASALATLAPATATLTGAPTFTRTPTRMPQSTATNAYFFPTDTPTRVPSPTATPSPTGDVVLTGTLDITRALSALYGPEGLTFTAAGLTQFPANQTFLTSTVKVLIAAPFTENNVEKYALVIGQEGAWGDCDACSVPIRAAIFAKQDDTWHAEWRDATDGFGFGITTQTPAGQLVQIGPNRYGFLFRDPLTGQGYSASALTLCANVHGRFIQILSLPFYSESLANPGAAWANWKYDSTYQFVAGENADYYDLRIATTGTKVVNGQLTPVQTAVVYTYQPGDEYSWAGYRGSLNATPPTPTLAATAPSDDGFTVTQGLADLYQSYPGAVVSDDMVTIPQVITDTCQPDCCTKCETPTTTFTMTWYINVVLAAPYDEAGRHKLAVLTEWTKGPRDGGDDSCHLCGADLGGGIFVKTGSTWVTETEDISNTVDTIGSWGHTPDGQLVQIGPNQHGFLFFPGTGGQGYSDEMLNLYGEVNGRLKRILFFDGFNESYPDFPGDDWPILGHTSLYRFKPGQNPSYYDLYIDTTGHCDGQEWLRATCGLRVYTFNGSEYVQTSGPALPTPGSPWTERRSH
jgi:hypothetical protein